MQKNELLKCGENIIRVLEIRKDAALVVGCTTKFMPKWVLQSELAGYTDCTEQELLSATGKNICEYDSLDKESRRFVHEHFTLIAGVLPFIGDEKKRCAMITSIAAEKAVSKQTIRYYLWLYLVYQDKVRRCRCNVKRCKIKWRDVSVCWKVVEKGIEIDCIEELCYNYQEINLNLTR